LSIGKKELLMKFAFIIYEGMTALDFIGVYDPITRLKTMEFKKDLDYDVCALNAKVRSFEGLEVIPNQIKNDLSVYDYIFIPGGNGLVKLINDMDFLSWMKTVSEMTILTSVCGGSLLFGAAGFLKGKKATTHPMLMGHLAKFTDKVFNSRIVEDDNLITARGVTSAIDLGLFICEKISGREVREKIQKQMDYLLYTKE
jgi:transcriptional regulator GlxA family with amidase domain